MDTAGLSRLGQIPPAERFNARLTARPVDRAILTWPSAHRRPRVGSASGGSSGNVPHLQPEPNRTVRPRRSRPERYQGMSAVGDVLGPDGSRSLAARFRFNHPSTPGVIEFATSINAGFTPGLVHIHIET
jgi:hypothetical protein